MIKFSEHKISVVTCPYKTGEARIKAMSQTTRITLRARLTVLVYLERIGCMMALYLQTNDT